MIEAVIFCSSSTQSKDYREYLGHNFEKNLRDEYSEDVLGPWR